MKVCTQDLVKTSTGQIKADVVIQGAMMINVNTKEIEKRDVAIKGEFIAFVGDVRHTIGEDTEIIEAEGLILSPGFMDAHIHVESSMMTVRQFALGVLPHGTTSIFMDPHEIANVMGLEGVKMMLEEGRDLPLKVFATAPSCVPANPTFDDTNNFFGVQEIIEAFQIENVVALGEMMNFPGVITGDPLVHQLLEASKGCYKSITGHYASPDLAGLQAYIAAGILSCHEATTKEESLERMRLGMYTKMREGSGWQDLKETIKAITETDIDSRYGILVSDDVHPNTLMEKGHMDYIVRMAIGEGLDPLTAIQMVTINPAQCFQLDRTLGSLAPGRYADILFLSDLETITIEKVMANGEMVAIQGKMIKEIRPFSYPAHFYHTVKTSTHLTPSHFHIPIPWNENKVLAHIIEAKGASARTYHQKREIKIQNNSLKLPKDVNLLMVMERHLGKKSSALGLVEGFQLQRGAIASTVAHDSHQLMVLGQHVEDMVLSGNILIERGGGIVIVEKGKVLSFLPLPIAGLLSDEGLDEMNKRVKELEESWRELGCTLPSPFMTMSLLSLPVIPEIRLTNRGLVDTQNFTIIDLIERISPKGNF